MPRFIPSNRLLSQSQGRLWDASNDIAYFDFRGNAGPTTTVPTGFGFFRAACIDSIQIGTSELVLIPSAPDVLRYGRADDSWDIGLALEVIRTNTIRDASNFSGVDFTVVPTVGRFTGEPDPLSPAGTAATRLTSNALGRLIALRSGLNPATAQMVSMWMEPTVAGTDIGLNTTGGPAGITSVSDVVLGASKIWRRLNAMNFGSGAGVMRMNAVCGPAMTGLAAGPKDWNGYGVQYEVGEYPTELIPTTGVAVQRRGTILRALDATWTPFIRAGRMSIEFSLRPKGSRIEFAADPDIQYLWHTFANFSAFLDDTGILTLRVPSGATNTCVMPLWARNDLLDLWFQVGGGLPTVVQYRINGGPTVSLPITGAPLGDVTGNLDLFVVNANSDIGNQFSSWLYGIGFYKVGQPYWAI